MQVCRFRSVRSWLSLGVLLFFFSALPILAEHVEDLPRPTDYVSDFAHVLSPGAIAQLDHICSQLDHSAADTQFAIVTVHNLDGDDVDDFANRLATNWSMGSKTTHRGLLILLAIDDRKRRIEVGGGLQGIITDADAGDVGRAMVPYLRQQNYDAAMLLGTERLAHAVADAEHVSIDEAAPVRPQIRRQPAHHTSFVGTFFLILLVIFVLIFLGGRGILGFLLGMLFGGWRGGGGWGGGGGGWSGGGGSGSGGGDSGFGGFGGGGDFDGGGAGGNW